MASGGASISALRRSCGKIVCVGRNYVAHAKELGNAVPASPVLFLKPTSSMIGTGDAIAVPAGADVHHEVELGVWIGRTLRERDAASASDAELLAAHVSGYSLALDMTARDEQTKAKNAGLPWSVAKGFDTFCPVSPAAPLADPSRVRLQCSVDDAVKQDGSTGDMLFDIPTLMRHITRVMTLEEGDLILTGTPAGVGPVLPGQTLSAALWAEGDSAPLLTLSHPVIARPTTMVS